MNAIKNITIGQTSRLHRPVGYTMLSNLINIVPFCLSIEAINIIFRAFSTKDAVLDTQRLWTIVGLLVVYLSVMLWAERKAYRANFRSAYEMSAEGRTSLAEHLRRLSLGFLSRHDPGDLSSMLITDFAMAETGMSHHLPQLMGALVMPILAFLWKYINTVDRVVFLGDYLDPYEDEDGLADDIYLNLMEIIALKEENMEKVVLLKGNHDQHYASEHFEELAGGTRMDQQNWNKYHQAFVDYKDFFKIAHIETINGLPHVFTHAGLTLYWLKKVNDIIWQLPDNYISIDDPAIIERINLLDDNGQGQDLLAIVGRQRSWFGEKTGSVLWADIEEHAIPHAPKAYGLNKVFQVFGHTKLNKDYDKLEFDNLAMIDSRQCFMIDSSNGEKITSIKDCQELGDMIKK